ncbi:hypothetical protein L1887_41837 [Cichorium endivia]|nr:hypothetical protein L1887_41837 [Cichorium endivia]
MNDVVDWGLYAMVKGICPTIDTSSSSFVAAIPTITTTFVSTPTTTTPTIPINNSQMLDGMTNWNLDSMVNGFYPTVDASSSSLLAVIPTITTTSSIPDNKSQVLDEIFNWNPNRMLNELYPNIGASSSSFDIVSPTTTTINTAPSIHLTNSQMLDETTRWDLHDAVNDFCPNIATSSPFISMTTSIPITTTITTPTSPIDVYNPPNSSFFRERYIKVKEKGKRYEKDLQNATRGTKH